MPFTPNRDVMAALNAARKATRRGDAKAAADWMKVVDRHLVATLRVAKLVDIESAREFEEDRRDYIFSELSNVKALLAKDKAPSTIAPSPGAPSPGAPVASRGEAP